MEIIVIFIIFALAFYVFFKIKSIRSDKPNEKKWLAAKSSVALGIFVGLFGLNRLLFFHSTVSIIVGIVFVVVGSLSAWTGYKAYKFYTPYVLKEKNGEE